MTVRCLVLVTVAVAAGCNFTPAYLDLSKRAPVAVEPEVDRILSEWERRRAKTASVTATFKVTDATEGAKEKTVGTGTLHYRTVGVGRAEFKAEDPKSHDVLLWTKENELWTIDALAKTAAVEEYDRPHLRDFMRGTPYVWLTRADKATLQRHGRIRKVSEDEAQVVLAVENVARPSDGRHVYSSLVVHLRKPDLLPTKLLIEERPSYKLVWELTSIRENGPADDRAFTPYEIDSETWEVTRRRPAAKPPAAKIAGKEPALTK